MSLILSNILKFFQSTVSGTGVCTKKDGKVLFGTCDDKNSRESLLQSFQASV